MDYSIIKKPRFIDNRGQLVEFLTSPEVGHQPFGHIYFVTFSKSGIIRGNHYHKLKSEYLGLVQGKVDIVIEDISTNERKTIRLDAATKEFELLMIGPNIAHTVISLVSNSILVDYFAKPYDHIHPDDYRYELIPFPKSNGSIR